MPEYPESVRKAAAGAVITLNIHGSGFAGLDTRQEAAVIANAVLDAVAEQLGEHCAQRILAHMESYGPRRLPAVNGSPLDRPYRAWRRYFGIAARVASRAFLTDQDMRRIAARELAAGFAALWPGPEDRL